MKRFMLLYCGFETSTPEVIKDWKAWLEFIAYRIIDQGFFAGSREFSNEGALDHQWGMDSFSGYNIIEAKNLDEAEKLTSSNPFFSSIKIFELR